MILKKEDNFVVTFTEYIPLYFLGLTSKNSKHDLLRVVKSK